MKWTTPKEREEKLRKFFSKYHSGDTVKVDSMTYFYLLSSSGYNMNRNTFTDKSGRIFHILVK